MYEIFILFIELPVYYTLLWPRSIRYIHAQLYHLVNVIMKIL